MTSLSKTVNPDAIIEPFAPLLRPIGQIDHSSNSGRRDAVRTENFRRGYDDGYARGMEEGVIAARADFEAAHVAALRSFVEDLQRRADQVDAAFEVWVQSLESPLAQLAAVVASRILSRELTTDPESILGLAREALQDVTHTTEARIKVNPMDSPVVRDHAEDLRAASSSLRKIEVVDDPSILGGCVIETEGGSIDARIESMLEQSRKALRGAL